MQSISLFISLATGVAASFLLFFLFYRKLRWDNKLAALLTAMIVLGIYIPLALLDWAGMDVFAIHFAFFAMSAYGLGIITSHHKLKTELDAHLGIQDEQPSRPRRFHWGPALIISFFLVLAVVDSIIITLASKGASSEFMARFLPAPRSGGHAVSAFPGAVAHDYQERYAQFNNYLEQLVTQRERGWQISEGWQSEPLAGQQTVFSIHVIDKTGEPVSGAQVQLGFLRPGNSQLDQSLSLPEGAPGQYGMGVMLPAPGNWNITLRIQRGEEVHQVKGVTQVSQGG
ncbi:MAG: FixH family protein [Thiolinea sp.]